MHIGIRVDASKLIGTGHFIRCLTLARALQQSGHQCHLLARHSLEYCEQLAHRAQIKLAHLPSQTARPTGDINSYAAWLGTSQRQDASDCIQFWERNGGLPNWVVVDHYGLDQAWERTVNAKGCQVLAIDDIANRHHHCDVLLDQNPWPNKERRYQKLVSLNCRQLLGPDYALLGPEFQQLRLNPPAKTDTVLVFFSGSDPTHEASKVFQAASHFDTLPFQVVIVTGSANTQWDQLKSLPHPDFVQLHKTLPNFSQALASSRYTLGGAGVSAIERACLQVPSTITCVAENQRAMAEHLAHSKQCRYLGLASNTTPETYKRELSYLAHTWHNISIQASSIDGTGVQHVVAALEATTK